MAGAFKYLEPTAPQPDPETVFSGVPKPAPYSHVPTTGEVSNLTRPSDTFADKVAQGVFDASPLSLIPGAYGVGQTIGEGLQDMDPGQLALGGAEAMFLGLPGMKRLQAAGKVGAGARGSEEAFNKAQGLWKQGADPRKVWDDTGWADGSQFGEYANGRPPQPVSWHGMPDIELKNYDPGIQKGAFLHRTEGTEDLAIAQPELTGLGIETRINPTLNPEVDDFVNRVALGQQPNDEVFKRNMHITGRNAEEARAYLMHETQHAADDNLKWSDMSPAYIHGTDAEKIWDALRTDARKAMRSVPPGQSPSLQLSNILGNASARSGDAARFAGYANNPVETKARMAASVYNFGSPEDITKGVYPGDIDPWSPEAFHPVSASDNSFSQLVGNPVEWRHYKKP